MAADAFRSGPIAPASDIDVVAIHCSEGRLQPHFQALLRERLALDTYTLVAVPGGPQFLTLATLLPKFSWVGWRWIKFVVDHTRPRRIILIAHDDCRWYAARVFQHRLADPSQAALSDLREVRAALTERFAGLTIEAWFARIDGQEVVFEPVR